MIEAAILRMTYLRLIHPYSSKLVNDVAFLP